MHAWHNTHERYGRVARWLHWTVAALFLASYGAVYYRHWFTVKDTPANWTALQLHLSVGLSIAVFVALRVIWTLRQVRPAPPPGRPWERRAARAAHGLLYVFMIVMPVTGYLGTKADTEFFFLFTVSKFADTALFDVMVAGWLGLSFEQWERPIDFVHKNSGAWLVWVLVLVHAGAALFHHFVRRDRTLLRMWAGR